MLWTVIGIVLLAICAAAFVVPRMIAIWKKRTSAGMSMLDEGWALECGGRLDQALDKYQESEHYFRERYSAPELARSIFLQARIYRQKEEYAKAAKKFENSISLCKSIQDNDSLPHAYLQLAETMTDQKSYKKARGYYKEAISLWQSDSLKKKHAGYAWYRLALSEAGGGIHENALLGFDESLEIFREYEDPDKLSDICVEIADIELSMGERGRALAHLQEAEKYYKRARLKDKRTAVLERIKTLSSEAQ